MAMISMGIDTALRHCSVAIVNDGDVLADLSEALERGHAERLAPMVVAALEAANLNISDLDRVGVVTGPGGFTGIRVGLSFARGLAIGSPIEVAGISSLRALAAGLDDAHLSTAHGAGPMSCLLYTSPSPRDLSTSRMPSSA